MYRYSRITSHIYRQLLFLQSLETPVKSMKGRYSLRSLFLCPYCYVYVLLSSAKRLYVCYLYEVGISIYNKYIAVQIILPSYIGYNLYLKLVYLHIKPVLYTLKKYLCSMQISYVHIDAGSAPKTTVKGQMLCLLYRKHNAMHDACTSMSHTHPFLMTHIQVFCSCYIDHKLLLLRNVINIIQRVKSSFFRETK